MSTSSEPVNGTWTASKQHQVAAFWGRSPMLHWFLCVVGLASCFGLLVGLTSLRFQAIALGQLDWGTGNLESQASALETLTDTTLKIYQIQAQFGWSVASAGDLNGDGYSDVLVGAPTYMEGTVRGGAVFIFLGSASGISPIPSQKLVCGQESAEFGHAISTAGDVNGDGRSDFLVGAPNFSLGQGPEGAAFLFFGGAMPIDTSLVVRFVSNNVGAKMGQSVACAGDVNGDHLSDIVLGAPHFGIGGAAFVFHSPFGSSGIDSLANDTLVSLQAGAEMGWSVASAGDVDGNGASDVIVGAPHFIYNLVDGGAAFLYYSNGLGLQTSIADTLSCTLAASNMGYSVSSAGDVNGDGKCDVLVGATTLVKDILPEGGVFLYLGGLQGSVQTAFDTIYCHQDGAYMGSSVACAGDVNGDGFSDVIIGAKSFRNSTVREGAAFLFRGCEDGLRQIASDLFTIPSNIILFGNSVASAGDVNGDGFSDVIMGAPWYSTTILPNQGAAYLHYGASLYFDPLGPDAAGIGNGFADMACAGDVNGDGYSDLVTSDTLGGNLPLEGSITVYSGSATGIDTSHAITIGGGAIYEKMGNAVAAAGDVNGDGFGDIIVGDKGHNYGVGAFFVYQGSNTGISMVNRRGIHLIYHNPPDSTSAFGFSVASAGDVNGDGYSDVIVGAPGFHHPQRSEGIALIYYGSPLGIDTAYADTLECDQTGANFGYSVSCAGDVNGDGFADVVVGAWKYDAGQNDEGAAFVFFGSIDGIRQAGILLQEDEESSQLGCAVAGTGDVNGDGFGDIVVGAAHCPPFQRGAAFVYFGAHNGIQMVTRQKLDPQVRYAFFGTHVGTAGDVNGDGYSDILVGAPNYFQDPSWSQGAVFVYRGSPSGAVGTPVLELIGGQNNAQYGTVVTTAGDINGDGYSDIAFKGSEIGHVYHGNGGMGLPIKAQQFRIQGTKIGAGGVTDTAGSVILYRKIHSFLGEQRMKMVWELKTNGVPFASTTGELNNSVYMTDQSPNWSQLSDSILIPRVNNLPLGKEYKWRNRVRYDLATAITGQVFGPWSYHKSETPEVPMLGFKTSALFPPRESPIGEPNPVVLSELPFDDDSIPPQDEDSIPPRVGSGFYLYPNPSNGSFSLGSLNLITSPIHLEIRDVTGKKLDELDMPLLDVPTAVPLRPLRSGNYFLIIRYLNQDVGNRAVLRFVVRI